MSTKRIGTIIGVVIAGILGILAVGGIGETVGASEIVVKQGMVDGHLTVWSQPGSTVSGGGA